jgi:hypothetical protein
MTTTSISSKSDIFGEDYREILETLSEGSVHRHFDPYLDIDWDSPEFQIDPEDPRWVLSSEIDPLGATQWYQDLPLERQIQIGRWRQANAIRVGAAFESILIRGLMQYAMTLPNGSPEFRYCMHEMTEECNHIQMFQELVNRIGVDVPGMRPFFRRISPLLGFAGGYLHVVLMIGILAGEEPIDHYQKSLLRSGRDIPAPVLRAMEIHIAEEARHISFAAEFLKARRPHMNAFEVAVCATLFPVVMRWLAGEIMTSPRSLAKEFEIPRDVYREAFWRSPTSRKIMASYFGDMRALATELGFMNRVSKRVWKLMGIDGEPSRYRGEPEREARTTS